jgi:hypothetical protein
VKCGCPPGHEHSQRTGFCTTAFCWVCRGRGFVQYVGPIAPNRPRPSVRDALVLAHALIEQNAPALFGVRISSSGPTLGKVITDALKED